MTRAKRILVLTSRYPFPAIGGERLRIHQICRQLARHHRLTLLSLCQTHQELHSPPPDDGVFAQVERVLLPRWRSIANTMAAVPGSTPLQVAYFRSARFAAKLQELLRSNDCVLAHLVRTGDYVRDLKMPTILEMTDAISLSYSRATALRTSRWMAQVFAVEARRLIRYEREIMDSFDVVSLVSDVDRSFLLGSDRKQHVIVCSNGVDTAALPYRDRRNSDPVVVFIGTMTSQYNVDACFYFATEILPLVRKELNCTFRVIGKIKHGDCKLLQRFEGVEVLGSVADIAVAVGNARVGVAPMRVGAGVQNKILEYMALGLPVITSPIGLEGLHARPGLDILLATEPAQYAACLRNLWNDGDLVSELGRNGYQYVRTHHTWEQTLAPLVSAVESL